MKRRLRLQILKQPDDTTCGPTCLHAVYDYFGDRLSLERVISEVEHLEGGGTLAVLLGCHALERGYAATIYTYNLQLFDPTWFANDAPDLQERLVKQMEAKGEDKLRTATKAYLKFLDLGGRMFFEDLTENLITRYLNESIPIITGLSATYLYRAAREFGPEDREDDVRGEPVGHFVVFCGYDLFKKNVLVADPYLSPSTKRTQYYEVSIERVVCSILLGIVTYDANLLVLEPGGERE